MKVKAAMRNMNSKASASGKPVKQEKQTRRLQQQALQREKEASRQAARQSARRRTLGLRIGAAVLAVAAVIAAVAYSLRGSSSTAGVAVAASLGPPTANVFTPPIGQFKHVGTPISQGGKPELLFIGAQYCPHCAGQRWAIIKALNQFGSFSHLTSSTNDDGTIPTFDLHGATYSSKYVNLVARDVEDRTHHPLDTLSGTEQSLFSQYDPTGGIPLVLVGGYSLIGDGYNLSDISGLSFSTVQRALQRNDSHVFVPEINAEANSITAFICHADGMKPASACSRSTIRTIVSHLQ